MAVVIVVVVVVVPARATVALFALVARRVETPAFALLAAARDTVPRVVVTRDGVVVARDVAVRAATTRELAPELRCGFTFVAVPARKPLRDDGLTRGLALTTG